MERTSIFSSPQKAGSDAYPAPYKMDKVGALSLDKSVGTKKN
jgi:hypothetical protein